MTTWPKISRAQVVANAKKGFGTGLNKVWYSQDTLVDGQKYRADCSGFVCRALGLTSAVGNGWWGGLNTVTLVSSGALKRLASNDDLKQGDLCGELGPGTAGDGGHVYVFDKWVNNDPNDTRMWIWEQCGGTQGPIHVIRNWPYPSNCAPYRYVGITDTEEDDMALDATKDYTAFKAMLVKFLNEPEWQGVVDSTGKKGTRSLLWMIGSIRAYVVGNRDYLKAGTDVAKLAAALRQAGVGDAVTDEQLARVLRSVLGSLDEPAGS